MQIEHFIEKDTLKLFQKIFNIVLHFFYYPDNYLCGLGGKINIYVTNNVNKIHCIAFIASLVSSKMFLKCFFLLQENTFLNVVSIIGFLLLYQHQSKLEWSVIERKRKQKPPISNTNQHHFKIKLRAV